MPIPTLESIPVFPGARDPQHDGASLEGGGRTGTRYTIDAPPVEVVAFYAERLARKGETLPDGTRWLFTETTTRPGEVVDSRTLVFVGPGPDGKGTRLMIGTGFTVAKTPPEITPEASAPGEGRSWSPSLRAILLLLPVGLVMVSVVVGLVADSFMAGVQVAVTVILLASFAGIVSGHWPTKS